MGNEPSAGSWSTIWFWPRRTVRKIVDSGAAEGVWILAMLGGIASCLSNSSAMQLGDTLPVAALLFFCALIGPAGGLLSLWIGGWLLHRIGMMLGGAASPAAVRAAVAWSWAPVVCMLPLWGVKGILFGAELFSSQKTRIAAEPVLGALYGLTALVDLVISVWSTVILVLALSEVNRFRVSRALAVTLISAFLLAVPVLILTSLLTPF